MTMIIFGALVVIVALVGGLFVGRKWGIKAGQKQAQQALAAQQAEFERQQAQMRQIERQRNEYGRQIAESQTTEEAADVLAQIGTSWNSGE